MTEQMVGGSADTLQLCTLPLELLPMLYSLSAVHVLLFLLQAFVLQSCIFTIVFLSPYKKPYERYNKLDVAMILPLGVISAGFLFIANKTRVSKSAGYILCIQFSLTPLVYFTIKFFLSIKHVVQKLSAQYGTRQRGDYENLRNAISAN